jgi:2',3'-cyclic-nucleotide 2'-phosphodiesterase (5'-nucleotidase family)
MVTRFAAFIRTLHFFLWLCSAGIAQAQQLEIIHTNDLHSFLEHAENESRGSYAAVKATIDRLKAAARANGVETLTLDAGDFSEGTPFYSAGDGTDSMRIMLNMGYDAIAIGNHEWLVGPSQMDWIFGSVKPAIPLLSANLHPSPIYPNLSQYIEPSAELMRAGLKIAVVGLSTNDLLYKWRLTDGSIDDPNTTMKTQVSELRATNDLVIALTHIGVDADESLAAHVSGVDLIVGGHSHTALEQPVWVKNPRGKMVPIVQAGAHGNFVGDMLVDYEAGKPLQILRYNLVPVYTTDPKDPDIAQQVIQARHDLETRYGAEWLYQVVTVSDTPMESPGNHPTAWGNFYMDAIREAANADMALDSSEFFGPSQPSGPITRENLMNFYPRYFDLGQPMGWTVWTIDVPGWLLKIVMEITVGEGSFYNLSQCEFDIKELKPIPEITNMKVGGKPLDVAKIYHVAVTEGLGLGSKDMNWFLNLFFKPSDSGIPVWTAVENKINRAAVENGGRELSLKEAAPNHLPSSIRWTPARVDRFLSF